MSSNQRVTTNFIRSNGVDVAYEFITKDYLLSVYPGIAQEIGKTPELWVWGLGSYGRLGNGATTGNISTPVTTFAGGTNWKQVSGGTFTTAAIKTDGTLWSWGYAGNGRLGNATTTPNRSTPVTTFAGGNNWKQVSCGTLHTAAIKTDGTLWTWGSTANGRLGNGATTGNISTPVTTFTGGTNWKQVSSGSGSYTAAIKTDGTLWTWGYNTNGQLGNASITSTSTPVTTFAGGTNWKQVAGGGSHTVAIKTDGTLWIWGLGTSGRLGNGATAGNISTPVTTFSGGTNWKQVACGSYTAAIKTDGTLWTWGLGNSGRLGTNDTLNRSTPVTTFAGGTNWKQISVGGNHTAAIKTDGTLWTWGFGPYGQLGNASTTFTNPTPVTTFTGGTNWKQVSGGNSHSAAIESADFI